MDGRHRVVAAFRDAEGARRAARELRALGVAGLSVRLVGPEEALGAEGALRARLPVELWATGGDFAWAGVERPWLAHVLLLAEGVPGDALPRVTRALRAAGAERLAAEPG